VTESKGGLATDVKVPLLQYIPRVWAPYFRSPDGKSHDRSEARAYYAIGDVDARGVYAFAAYWRKSLPQQVAHDLGGLPSCAGSKYDLLGDLQVGTISDVTSGGTASGGTSHCPDGRSWRCYYASSDGRGWGFWSPPIRGARSKGVQSPSSMSVFAWHVD
jgi:hypothetical protein